MEFQVAVVAYQEDEYQEIKRISADGDKLEATWSIWKPGADKRLARLKSMGILAEYIIVHPIPFQEYCTEKKLELKGKSRAEFAQHLLDQKNKSK